MKKMFVLFLSLLFTVSFAGCADPSDSKDMPDDFSFALTWNCYGISSYDSATGKLVKTTDTSHPEDYITDYVLFTEQKEHIYAMLKTLDVNAYPDIYDPHEDGLSSKPPMTLILTVRTGGSTKTIKAKNIAVSFASKNQKGQEFLTACETIINMLTASEEWKAFPDYEKHYE